jgi:hypothetical protein
MARKKVTKPSAPSESPSLRMRLLDAALTALIAGTVEGAANVGVEALHHEPVGRPTGGESTEPRGRTDNPSIISYCVEKPSSSDPPFGNFSVSVVGSKGCVNEQVIWRHLEPSALAAKLRTVPPTSDDAVRFEITGPDLHYVAFVDRGELLDALTAKGDLSPADRETLGDVMSVKIGTPAPIPSFLLKPGRR